MIDPTGPAEIKKAGSVSRNRNQSTVPSSAAMTDAFACHHVHPVRRAESGADGRSHESTPPGLTAGRVSSPKDFVLGRFRTRTVAEGFLEEDGELWTADGALVAQSRQLAISLPG